jgi:hypothetical protein
MTSLFKSFKPRCACAHATVTAPSVPASQHVCVCVCVVASELHTHSVNHAASVVHTKRTLSSTINDSLSSTLIRSLFQVKPALLQIPIDPFLILCGGGVINQQSCSVP